MVAIIWDRSTVALSKPLERPPSSKQQPISADPESEDSLTSSTNPGGSDDEDAEADDKPANSSTGSFTQRGDRRTSGARAEGQNHTPAPPPLPSRPEFLLNTGAEDRRKVD